MKTMCRKLDFWDTRFRFCEGKAWRYNKRSKKWERCDTNAKDSRGYIMLNLTNDNGQIRKFKLSRLTYLAYNPSWNIFDNSKNNYIDHIDRIKTNDNIDNLRVVSCQKNNFNQTGRKGYSYHKQRGKFQADIRIDGKTKYLGLFENEQDARNAYLEAKKIYHII